METNRREGLTNAAPAVAKAVRWGHVGNGGTRNIEPVFPTRVRNIGTHESILQPFLSSPTLGLTVRSLGASETAELLPGLRVALNPR